MTNSGSSPGVSNPSSKDYAEVATWAWKNKDWSLAAEQISAALALDPQDDGTIALFERIVFAMPGALRFFEPSAPEQFFGVMAARARLLAKCGRTTEALGLLFQAVRCSPNTPYLLWATPWFSKKRVVRAAAPQVLTGQLLAVLETMQIQRKLLPGAQQNLVAGLELTRRFISVHPLVTVLYVVQSRLLRSLGEVAGALQALDAAPEKQWELEVEKAAVLLRAGRRLERLEALKRAIDLRPEDLATHLDLAEAYVAEGWLLEAIGAFSRVLALEPSHKDATAYMLYSQALTGELLIEEAVERLLNIPDVNEAVILAVGSYVSFLTPPLDPLVGVIHAVEGRKTVSTDKDQTSCVNVTIDGQLDATALRAFGLLQQRFDIPISLRSDNVQIPTELAQVMDCLAEHETASVVATVRGLLQKPFKWSEWQGEVRSLAWNHTTLTLGQWRALLAAPPQSPSGVELARWIHGWQVVTAMAIALSDAPDSDRRNTLDELLNEEDGWVRTAGAMAVRAFVDAAPAYRLWAEQRLLELSEKAGSAPAGLALAVAAHGWANDQEPFLRLRARAMQELANQKVRLRLRR